MISYCNNLKSLFEQVADVNPEQIALKYSDNNKSLTYKNLNEYSNQLAHYLLDNNVKKHDVIAIANNKEPSTFIIMLACLKIGAIYTNIDEDNPLSRTEKIISCCAPKILFIDASIENHKLSSISNEKAVDIIFFDQVNLHNYSKENVIIEPEITAICPAYIMFTSGSTGTPKGVTITHGNLLSFIHWSIERFDICKSDIFANVSPIYFDNSVFDIFTCLFSGATLAPIDKAITKQPLQLVKIIDELKCTIWFSVPSLLIYLKTFKVLTKDSFCHIRSISFGGEGFPKSELKKIYDLYAHRMKFINVYGPTEATCICSSYEVKYSDFDDLNGILPIGFINPNFDYLILDKQNEPVADGEVGELCISGPNISLGYYGDLEKTKNVFISNPLITSFHELMYRTGDLVYRNNGNHMLYFSGRIDNQIKHMGYRIELDEVEHAINFLPYVLQSAVVYQRTNNDFGKIIAYIVWQEIQSEEQLVKDIINVLPEYMIPNNIYFLAELPINANGKVDRKSLLARGG